MKLMFLTFLLIFLFIPNTFSFELVISTPKHSIDGEHLKDKTLPINRLSPNGAVDSEVLYFTGLNWKPAPLTGLTFRGAWNPTKNDNPQINFEATSYNKNGETIDAVTGDYFIAAESTTDRTWNKGDWAVFNGQSWERINNTGVILSIFGRKNNVVSQAGDYNWNQIDKSESSVFDLSDIKKPESELGGHEGDVLKWSVDKESWELASDNKGSIQGEVTSEDILDGEVTNVDLSDSSPIQISKISGFSGDIGKLETRGGRVQNLNLHNNKLITGDTGKIILLKENDSTTEIFFSALKDTFDLIISTFSEKENAFRGSGVETQFLSEEVGGNGQRVWKEFNLDFALEGERAKFQDDLNVWGSVLGEYNASAPETVTEEDTIKSALGKLEGQLDRSSVTVETTNEMIEGQSIDPLKHFLKPSAGGFLRFDADKQKSWGFEFTSGVQFKGEISHESISDLPTDAVSGDYYVLTSSGIVAENQWNEGDWAIYDGVGYLQINNSGNLLSFNSRAGAIESCPGSPTCPQGAYDYDWSMIDKTNSKLSDMPDIQTPTASTDDNKVLKRIGGKWVLEKEKTGIGEGATVPLSSISEGAIENRHLLNVNLNQVAGKLNGETFEDELGHLFEKSGGELSGDVDLDENNLLGVSEVYYSGGSLFNMSEAIDLASNMNAYLASKQDELPSGGSSSQILVSKDGGLEYLSLNTDNVSEGINNLYFTEDRVLGALGFPENSDLENPSLDINYGGDSPDTLGIAFEKILKRIEQDDTPQNNSLGASAIQEKSLSKSSFYPAGEVGQTIMFFGGEWGHRSIAGLNLKGSLDLGTANPPNIDGLQDGDYYIINGAGKIDGVDFAENDWAVYSRDANGFNRLSKKQGIQSFNKRTGDIVALDNDYTWEMIDKSNSPLSTFSTQVLNYSTLGDADVGKILKWNGLKWEASLDNQGVDPSTLSLANFSSGINKSITNQDIGFVDFSQIQGLEEMFQSRFIDLSSDPVVFHGQLNFKQNAVASIVDNQGITQEISLRYSINNVGNILDSANNILFNFNDLSNKCGSLDSSQFEKFGGEGFTSDGKKMFLNANKNFVELIPELLIGDVAGALFDPNKVRGIKLESFSKASSNFSLTANNSSINQAGTSLTEVFNKLAGKVHAFVNQVPPGVINEGADVQEGEFLEIDESFNGKMIFVEDANVKIMDSVGDGFEVTIKRVDPVGINPKTINIGVQLESGQIEGKSRFLLKENFASITLKLVKENPNSLAEFVVLRRSGEVY